ncbi:hypothetical protein AABB24_012381 [Solanum stoloniferum]|uniref:F-box domain-containing protein n=1 Tax=Solanum stoloniferum TaxID=62892 RepID=A0ABD2U654_9SOLN
MDFPTSVIKVTGNTELLTEILLGLPPKSLLCFQTVCKDWLFHISIQRFRLLHSRTKQMSSLKVDGLFFCWWVYKKKYVDFIPINGISEKQKSMILKHTTSSKIEHLHSCEAPVMEMINCTLFNYNPSTNQRRLIPPPCTITNPSHHEVMVMNLVFDPMVSDRYEIVCIYYEIRRGLQSILCIFIRN